MLEVYMEDIWRNFWLETEGSQLPDDKNRLIQVTETANSSRTNNVWNFLHDSHMGSHSCFKAPLASLHNQHYGPIFADTTKKKKLQVKTSRLNP